MHKKLSTKRGVEKLSEQKITKVIDKLTKTHHFSRFFVRSYGRLVKIND